jgi:hypothetical protein
MLTISDLLSAAKRGAGIPSNYRLARVLGLTDSGVQRWTSGRGVPDDAQAHRMAVMAGLDSGYVIASVRALREKDESLRAIWADMAERLLLTSGMPPRHDGGAPPTSENGPGSGGGGDEPSNGAGGALMSSDESHIMRSSTPSDARLRRIAKASLGRALKAKKAH